MINVLFLGKQLNATFVSFDDLLSQSDFVFIACPLNAETRNTFNKAVFEKMKKSSVLINVSRGGICRTFFLFCFPN